MTIFMVPNHCLIALECDQPNWPNLGCYIIFMITPYMQGWSFLYEPIYILYVDVYSRLYYTLLYIMHMIGFYIIISLLY